LEDGGLGDVTGWLIHRSVKQAFNYFLERKEVSDAD
jgi:hypothetical protein